MGIIRIPTYEEHEKSLAGDIEDKNLPGCKNWKDEYRDYLEEQKEILLHILLSGLPLTALDRREIADLLCPERYEQAKSRKSPGRPTGTTTTFRRDFKITYEYEQLYTKGGSESALIELQQKYGFKDRSSILKSINNVKKYKFKHGVK